MELSLRILGHSQDSKAKILSGLSSSEVKFSFLIKSKQAIGVYARGTKVDQA